MDYCEGGEPAVHPWDVVRDLDEAKTYAWDTPTGDEEFLWTDLREYQMAEIRGATYGQPSFSAIKESLSGNLKIFTMLVRQRLDDCHRELLDDVVGDLYNCAFNRAVNGANGFFEQLFDAYRAGGWPCSWAGEISSGRLIVYFPK
jgi:hypothetical protein